MFNQDFIGGVFHSLVQKHAVNEPLNGRSTQTPHWAWNAAKDQVSRETPKAVFDTYVSDAVVYDYQGGRFVIAAPTVPAAQWMEGRLSSMLTRLLTGITNQPAEVQFITAQDVQEQESNI